MVVVVRDERVGTSLSHYCHRVRSHPLQQMLSQLIPCPEECDEGLQVAERESRVGSAIATRRRSGGDDGEQQTEESCQTVLDECKGLVLSLVSIQRAGGTVGQTV